MLICRNHMADPEHIAKRYEKIRCRILEGFSERTEFCLYRMRLVVEFYRSGEFIFKEVGSILNADTARLDQIEDVVAGRPVSEQSGAATRLALVL